MTIIVVRNIVGFFTLLLWNNSCEASRYDVDDKGMIITDFIPNNPPKLFLVTLIGSLKM